jgi:hypothetical protein
MGTPRLRTEPGRRGEHREPHPWAAGGTGGIPEPGHTARAGGAGAGDRHPRRRCRRCPTALRRAGPRSDRGAWRAHRARRWTGRGSDQLGAPMTTPRESTRDRFRTSWRVPAPRQHQAFDVPRFRTATVACWRYEDYPRPTRKRRSRRVSISTAVRPSRHGLRGRAARVTGLV